MISPEHFLIYYGSSFVLAFLLSYFYFYKEIRFTPVRIFSSLALAIMGPISLISMSIVMIESIFE